MGFYWHFFFFFRELAQELWPFGTKWPVSQTGHFGVNLKEVTVRSYLFLLAEDVISLFLNDIYDMMILSDSPSEYSISIGIMWHTQHCSKVMHLNAQITLLL